MFVLMHIAMPIGKGTKEECEAMLYRLRQGKEHSQAFDLKYFMILTLAEYEAI